MKLSDSVEMWAECALQKVKIDRRNTSEEIEKAGYDIKIAAKKLEQIYLEKYDKYGVK